MDVLGCVGVGGYSRHFDENKYILGAW